MCEEREALLLVEDHCGGVGEALGGLLALDELQARWDCLGRLVGRLVNPHDELGVFDDVAELRGHGFEGFDVRRAEAVVGIPLEDQDAHLRESAGNRHGQERIVAFLENPGEELVIGAPAGVGHADRPHLLEGLTGQAPPKLQTHPAHGFRVQAAGGPQRQFAFFGVVEVDRAHGGLSPLGDHVHRLVQQRLDAGAVAEQVVQLVDIVQQPFAIHGNPVHQGI